MNQLIIKSSRPLKYCFQFRNINSAAYFYSSYLLKYKNMPANNITLNNHLISKDNNKLSLANSLTLTSQHNDSLFDKFLIHSQHQSSFSKNQQNPNKQSNSFIAKWIKRILFIAFVVKILQQKGYKCDYDINDMMITIQLQQRLLEQQQDKKRQSEQQQQSQSSSSSENTKNKKKKGSYKPKRSSIKQGHDTKDDRYGTVEQMLKHQMSSSQEFHSVEERIVIKQKVEQKREQQKEGSATILNDGSLNKDQGSGNQRVQEKANDSQQKQESLASHIFSKAENVITKLQQVFAAVDEHGNSEQKEQPVLSNSNSNQQQGISLPQTQTNVNNPKTQSANLQQNLNYQPFIDGQNKAIIYLESQSMSQISKRIQSFLQLRGINVRTQIASSLNSNQILKIRLCNKLSDCKDIQFQSQEKEKRDMFHHINNFLNPPHIIATINQAKQLLALLENDQSLVGSYIPKQSPQYEAYLKKPIFDTFSDKHPPINPLQAQKRFNQYKYLSSSKKNCFIIVRDEQVAKYLKIPTNKIGTPHILFKYDKELNEKQSQPNCKIDGQFYHAIGNIDRVIQKENLDTVEKVAHKINTLTEKGFTHTNAAQDIHDKIRQLNEQVNDFSFTQQNDSSSSSKLKKLLLIKANDPQSEKQINQILQKVSKLNKGEVSIIKTQSEALMKALRVFNNEEYASIRLFDLQHIEEPIVKQIGSNFTDKNFFQRYIPQGPFQIEYLSRWISNLSPFDKPYVQHDKSLNKLNSSYPHDFQIRHKDKTQSLHRGTPKLVLFYKQGCKGCKLMQQLFGYLSELQQKLKQGESEAIKRLKRQICLRYRISDPEQLAHIQISKFNILNDDPTIEVPQTTPTIHLYNQKNTQKYVINTEQVFSQLNRIKNGNNQIVHDFMIRELIEEIQRNVRKMDNIV